MTPEIHMVIRLSMLIMVTKVTMVETFIMVPVLEIDYRGYHGRKTKDFWENQKAGGPKNLTA